MSARTYLQAKVDDYLAERRQLGFELHRMEYALRSLVSYVEPKFLSYPVAGRIGCEQLDCISVG